MTLQWGLHQLWPLCYEPGTVFMYSHTLMYQRGHGQVGV